MSKQLDKLKTTYSGWHNFAEETPTAAAPDQTDIEAEIERRVAERLAAAPKKAKPKLEAVE